jgi:protein involved in polysaccharide export with SLBB domain
MKYFKLPALWVICIPLVVMSFSFNTYSQGLGDVKQLCDNATAANKAMARQAGYDLDQLCGEITAAAAPKIAVEAPDPVARDTVSSSEEIAVAVAPVAVSGIGTVAPASSLKPFGYDLFANAPTTYAPASSIPVSGDYLLGPGDTLDILFYGKTNDAFSLDINREGFVNFPELGPVGLAGLTYAEAKEMLQSRISAQIIGTQVSISMGSLRSMQIFVLGEAFKPGAYTVSSLSTITHALVSSGGVSDIGSLRNIQLKRQGKLIATLDLYDLLLSGDTSKDVRVQAADVIYIPTVGDLVSVEGQVLRPAIYELKGGESVGDLVSLAGDLGPKAFSASSRLQRINDDGFMTVMDLSLKQSKDRAVALQAGDHLVIDAITDYKKDIVTLSGAVRHEGEFSWREGMRVSDIISDRNKLNPDADLDVSLLVRELDNSADIEVFIFSLGNIFQDASGIDNFELQSRDQIAVLPDYQDRADALAPFIDNLKRQASIDSLPRIVTSGGTVRYPGDYPLSDGMTVKDLINLSGGLIESAYSQSAEISRTDLSDPNRAVTSIIVSDLTIRSSSRLEPSDYVEFRTIPEFRESETITLKGEFIFPGTYVFEKGEFLSSVIQRAGGFTNEAFVDGSVFLRESLAQREQQEIDRLLELLNDELSRNSLRDSNSDIAVDSGKFAAQREAIASLSNSVATGRLVVSLSDIMAYRSQDVVLKDGDQLIVPKLSQEVTVLGEVRRPTSYLFDPDFSQSDYIERSGGYKDRANKSDVYIVKAGGEVIMPKRGLFKFRSAKNSISPGDTIVVPLDTDDTRIQGIPLLAEVSTIVYQLSLGAAAIKSFNNN